jgi:hypothetical protein
MLRIIALVVAVLLATGCQKKPPLAGPASVEGVEPPPVYIPLEQACPPIPECPPLPSKLTAHAKWPSNANANDDRMSDGKLLLGETEYATLYPGDLHLEARIDTGATTTSLHAIDIKTFERDGQRWVRFTTLTERGGEITLELPRVRHVRIKGEGDEYERRAVVAMDIQIGSVRQKVETTLTDRDNYQYPLLVGRNFLRDHAVVDVSRRYVQGGNGDADKNSGGNSRNKTTGN